MSTSVSWSLREPVADLLLRLRVVSPVRWGGVLYLLLTLAVAAAVAVSEYRVAAGDVITQLQLREAASRGGLVAALASRRVASVRAVAAELAAAPYVTGITVLDVEAGVVVVASGTVPDQNGEALSLPPSWGLLSHSFLLDPRGDGMGGAPVRVTLFSDGGAVRERLAARAATILAALVIQSAALWLLFLHLTRRLVSQPLARLTAQVENPRLEAEAFSLPLAGLSALEGAVREMRRRIRHEFRGLVENAHEGMAVIQDGRFHFANRALAALLGHDHAEALAGLNAVTEVVLPADRNRAERLFRRLVSRLEALPHVPVRLDLPLPGSQGERWVQLRFQRVEWRGGPGILVSVTDISRYKRRHRALLRLAGHDPLTGALNRRRFVELGTREVDRGRRYAHPLSVLVLDIDHFKAINDTHGHGVGDIVLTRLVERVRSSLRDSDLLGRIGGEEFAVLLPDTGEEGARVLAERIRRTVGAMDVLIGPLQVRVTVSIGIADRVGGEGETLSDGIRRADSALYRAKALGRNRVELGAPPPPVYAGADI